MDGAALAAPDVDSTIIQRESFRYGGNAELRMLARQTFDCQVGYGYTKTDLTRDPMWRLRRPEYRREFRATSCRESASLRIGYALQESTFEGSSAPVTRIQNLNIGVDYRKPLSRSRRTFLRFSTGSVISEQVAASPSQSKGGASRPRVASLVHQMGRTWSAQAQYRRQVGYLDGFARPVFSDSANVAVGGLMTRRVDLFLNANYITGTIGLRQDSPRF